MEAERVTGVGRAVQGDPSELGEMKLGMEGHQDPASPTREIRSTLREGQRSTAAH